MKLVTEAGVIIRAPAVEYASPPSSSARIIRLEDTTVRFKVTEVIRGPKMSELILPGYLADKDDFNDEQPPYTFVRPGGRGGSCYAYDHRSGAEFLLFLKGVGGNLTVQWYPLAPVNEQLHSDDDPWLLWVREKVKEWVKR
jgi:hypothetical protein